MIKHHKSSRLVDIVGITLSAGLLMIIIYNCNRLYMMVNQSEPCMKRDAMLFCKGRLETKSWVK